MVPQPLPPVLPAAPTGSPTLTGVGDLLTFAVYALATVSLTVLVKDDEITRAPRRWFERQPKGTLRRYWITCVYCISMATALLPATAWVLNPNSPWVKIPAALLAFRWLAVKMYTWQRLLEGKAALYATPAAEDVEAQ